MKTVAVEALGTLQKRMPDCLRSQDAGGFRNSLISCQCLIEFVLSTQPCFEFRFCFDFLTEKIWIQQSRQAAVIRFARILRAQQCFTGAARVFLAPRAPVSEQDLDSFE